MSTLSIDISQAIELSPQLGSGARRIPHGAGHALHGGVAAVREVQARGRRLVHHFRDRDEPHCGTHIEFPFHHIKGGQDSAAYPLSQLIGEGVVIDISRWRSNNSKITLADLQSAAAGKIRRGDMVFFLHRQ